MLLISLSPLLFINCTDKILVFSFLTLINKFIFVYFSDDVAPVIIDKHSAAFMDLYIDQHNYTFEISSVNTEGVSHKTSIINIPSKSELLDVDLRLAVSDNGNHYEPQWRAAGKDADWIQNFTIFWCPNRFPNSCGERLRYKTVDRSQNSFKLMKESDKPYYFTIAANSKYTTTGMQIFTCLSKPPKGNIAFILVFRLHQYF